MARWPRRGSTGAGKASEEGERGGEASEREARQGERGEARRTRRGKASEARQGERGEASIEERRARRGEASKPIRAGGGRGEVTVSDAMRWRARRCERGDAMRCCEGVGLFPPENVNIDISPPSPGLRRISPFWDCFCKSQPDCFFFSFGGGSVFFSFLLLFSPLAILLS